MKAIDLSALKLQHAISSDPTVKTQLSQLFITTGEKFSQVGNDLAKGNDAPITIGEVLNIVADIGVAIAAVTPSKKDDAAALIARSLIKLLNR